MSENVFDRIPEWIEVKILSLLDFSSLLTARATCQRWFEIVHPWLGEKAILNIRMDHSLLSKQFRRGQWNELLIANYQEIRIIPKTKNAFLCGKVKGKKNCTIKHFTDVKKFTLFENGSFLHFVHRYMRHLPSVKYVQIRELPFTSDKTEMETKYTFVEHAFSRALAHMKSWRAAMDNLVKVETLRIRLFDRLATILYMQIFAFRMTSLTNVELDFTKLYENPLTRPQLNEINNVLVEILEHCFLCLRHLRLKWAIRVDTDLDYARSEEELEPFMEFLFCLRSSVWFKLRLQQLSLTFPVVNFGITICETTILPFLQGQQPTLKRVSISRVLPGDGITWLVTRLSPNFLQKFELSFYFRDEIIPALVPQPVIVTRGLEILLQSDSTVDFSRLPTVNRGSRRESGLKYFMHFKLINGHNNINYVKPDLIRITDCFQHVRILEILDSSTYGKTYATISSADFNLIIRKLTKLVSLKLSNASGLSDVGLTRISKEKIKYMNLVGVFHLDSHSSPLSQTKELRFLDLRDLSSMVTDISVFFAFQHIKKLEKISFHGNHSITLWGKEILKRKYNRNPYFDAIFRPSGDDYISYGNYTLPSADFP